jgi:predicted enzyme related to lactoylglutathione lyase
MAGKPVHIEIGASDTKRALKFYGDLLGWQFRAMEGPFEYHMTQTSDDTGAAIFPSEEGPKVLVYYDVDDIDAGRKRVGELGGSAEDKMPVPTMGWFVQATDTEGNRFGLWQNDPNAPAPQK